MSNDERVMKEIIAQVEKDIGLSLSRYPAEPGVGIMTRRYEFDEEFVVELSFEPDDCDIPDGLNTVDLHPDGCALEITAAIWVNKVKDRIVEVELHNIEIYELNDGPDWMEDDDDEA